MTSENFEKMIINTSGIMDSVINSKDLLKALKDDIFKNEDAVVIISSAHDTNALTMVYECSHCKSIHLFAGKYKHNPFPANFYNTRKIHVNYTLDPEMYVTKRELIALLEKLPAADVLIECPHVKDNGDYSYALTRVFKCEEKECDLVHLSTGYEVVNFNLN